MERLNKQNPQAPSAPLTAGQKEKIAELERRSRAKVAEKELFLKPKIQAARGQGDPAVVESLEKQLRDEIRFFREELERDKEKVRQEK